MPGDMGAHAVLRIREEPLDLTSALDVSVPRNPTPQLCAQLVLAHLMHTLAMRLDTEVAVRIEHALAAASSTLDKTAIHCRDCRRLLRQIQRDGRSCVLEAHPARPRGPGPKVCMEPEHKQHPRQPRGCCVNHLRQF